MGGKMELCWFVVLVDGYKISMERVSNGGEAEYR